MVQKGRNLFINFILSWNAYSYNTWKAIPCLLIAPLTATLINDTPRVEGAMVTINFRLDGGSPAERTALRCRITGPGRTPTVVIENCMSVATTELVLLIIFCYHVISYENYLYVITSIILHTCRQFGCGCSRANFPKTGICFYFGVHNGRRKCYIITQRLPFG